MLLPAGTSIHKILTAPFYHAGMNILELGVRYDERLALTQSVHPLSDMPLWVKPGTSVQWPKAYGHTESISNFLGFVTGSHPYLGSIHRLQYVEPENSNQHNGVAVSGPLTSSS